MKTKTFLTLALTLCLVACNQNQPNKAEIYGDYVGTVTVKDGLYDTETRQPVGDFVQDDATISIEKGSTTNTCNIVFHQVQFTNMMPVKIDMEVPDAVLNDNTITGENIIPNMLAGDEREPFERYLVTALQATVQMDNNGKPQKLSMSLNFGKSETVFVGEYSL